MANHPNRPAKSLHYLMRCADYNGHKDVLFMMKSDDFRFGTANWTALAVGKFDRKAKTLTTEHEVFRVYPDWSVKKLADG